MQITIVQTEIEQAIENYVKSMISVNDDQKISIDLKATRGDTGMQAFIDIVPRTKKVLTSSTAGSAGTTAPVVKADPKPEVKEEVQETAAEQTEEVEQQAEAPARKGVEIEVDEEGNPVKPAGAPKSLFGNLKKPVNQAAEAE